MANKHLLTSPHFVRGRKDAWWYEQVDGICIVVECRDEKGRWLETKQVTIPWATLRSALGRKDEATSDGE